MSDEENKEVAWADAFPWIERAVAQQKRRVNLPSPADLSRQWLRAIDTQAEAYPVMLERVVELADDAMPMTSLGELFPFVPHSYDMTYEAMEGITRNDPAHPAPNTFEEIEPTYLVDSVELENWGVFNIKDFVGSLANVNVRYAISHEIGLADLVKELPPITATKTEEASEALTYEPADTVYELVEEFLTQFNDRDLQILIGRKLAKPQKTLDAIGAEFGITRERIRQLEGQINRQVAAWFENNDEVALHSHLIREHVGTLCTLDSLLAKFPALLENIMGLDLPSWYVFDQFDDSFESDGTWVAVPSLQDVAGEFDGFFDANATDEGYVEIDRLTELLNSRGDTDATTLISWAKSRGYHVIGDLLVGPSVRSMNSLAVVALAHLGVPTSEEELHQLVAADKSIRSFSNQLAGDSRMIRAANGTWALSSWGGSEYRGIREEILRRVDVTGSVLLSDLKKELPALFNVSPNSVHTYATSWPLESVGGVVRRAVKPATPNRPLYRGRGVIFIDGGLAYRMVVNADNMRGSGFPIPSPLAGALGINQGSEKEFIPTGDEKPILVRWTKPQPQVSSIRPNLQKIGAKAGDVVAVTFIDGVSNVLSYGPLKSEPGEAIRQLLLLDSAKPMTTAAVASALGIQSNSNWQQILDLVQLRHENDLLAAIHSFMSQTA